MHPENGSTQLARASIGDLQIEDVPGRVGIDRSTSVADCVNDIYALFDPFSHFGCTLYEGTILFYLAMNCTVRISFFIFIPRLPRFIYTPFNEKEEKNKIKTQQHSATAEPFQVH